MPPHEDERYKERSAAERANSRLREDFGTNNVMVKERKKIQRHETYANVAIKMT